MQGKQKGRYVCTYKHMVQFVIAEVHMCGQQKGSVFV